VDALLLVLSAGAGGFSCVSTAVLVLTVSLEVTSGGGGADISGFSADFAGLGAIISIAELLGADTEILA